MNGAAQDGAERGNHEAFPRAVAFGPVAGLGNGDAAKRRGGSNSRLAESLGG